MTRFAKALLYKIIISALMIVTLTVGGYLSGDAWWHHNDGLMFAISAVAIAASLIMAIILASALKSSRPLKILVFVAYGGLGCVTYVDAFVIGSHKYIRGAIQAVSFYSLLAIVVCVAAHFINRAGGFASIAKAINNRLDPEGDSDYRKDEDRSPGPVRSTRREDGESVKFVSAVRALYQDFMAVKSSGVFAHSDVEKLREYSDFSARLRAVGSELDDFSGSMSSSERDRLYDKGKAMTQAFVALMDVVPEICRADAEAVWNDLSYNPDRDELMHVFLGV